MENGAVYRPTTEEDPVPGRGARSGLAAWFVPGRLRFPRMLFKVSQLVSPWPRPAGGRAGGGVWSPAVGLRACEAAQPPLLSVVVQEAAVSTPPVPSLSARGGDVTLGPPPLPLGGPASSGLSPGGSPMATEGHRARSADPGCSPRRPFSPRCCCSALSPEEPEFRRPRAFYLSLALAVFLVRARGAG